MKRVLVAAIALIGINGAAVAADMAIKAAVPARPSCAGAQWQGGYIGVSGGGLYHDATRIDSDGFLTDNSGYSLKKFGGLVGGQIGYNFANCNTFWGFEVDGSWAKADNTFIDNPNAAAPNTINTEFNALITGRMRAGVALDSMLLYVTGGVAAARLRTTWTDLPDTVTFAEWRVGWTAGLGTEWAFSQNLSLKSEILYTSFGDRDNSVVFANFGPASFRHSDSAWVSRIGLNYRWGAR